MNLFHDDHIVPVAFHLVIYIDHLDMTYSFPLAISQLNLKK